MIIRRLMSRHMPAVGEHFRRLPAEDIYLRFIQPVSVDWVLQQYLPKISLTSHIALGAFDGDKVVGFCHIAPYPESGFVELGLSIDVDCRRRGLGSQLLRRAKIYATLLGFSELRVLCSRENRKMIALAKRHGVACHGVETKMEGVTALRTVDAGDLTSVIHDEQAAGVRDVVDATILAPIEAFRRFSGDLAESPVKFQRQLNRYSLNISEKQAQILESALDLYARLLLGQTEAIDMLARMGYIAHGTLDADRDLDEVEQVCKQLKKVLTGHEPSASFGIFSDKVHDSARVAWDIAKVVRHRLAWDRQPQGGFGNQFDMPSPSSAIEPLCEMMRATGVEKQHQ